METILYKIFLVYHQHKRHFLGFLKNGCFKRVSILSQLVRILIVYKYYKTGIIKRCMYFNLNYFAFVKYNLKFSKQCLFKLLMLLYLF